MNSLTLSGKLNIAVIGGGNIGTQFACICATKGHKVNICSSRAREFGEFVEMIDEHGVVTVGKINAVSENIEEVIRDCDVIFVTYPTFQLQKLAKEMLPYVREGMVICVLPGTGGSEFAFKIVLMQAQYYVVYNEFHVWRDLKNTESVCV